ncbi:MAG: response regulator [Clostridia bacterium]|nr:response regulator [Clostridia bacterium]
MRIIAVEDEKTELVALVKAIRNISPSSEVDAFDDPLKAIEFVSKKKADIAFLDINMPNADGIKLAEVLKQGNRNVNIIFITAHKEYMEDAFNLHASGYLIKPISDDKVKKELDDLRHPVENGKRKPILRANCFGNFDLQTMDGKSVYFERQKSKELFAYLVFRRGAACTIKEIAAVLFEDDPYDNRVQSYLQKIISAMMKNLKAIGAEDVIDKGYNSLGVIIDLIECDYIEVLNNTSKAASLYKGEFMCQYEWAEAFNAFFM